MALVSVVQCILQDSTPFFQYAFSKPASQLHLYLQEAIQYVPQSNTNFHIPCATKWSPDLRYRIAYQYTRHLMNPQTVVLTKDQQAEKANPYLEYKYISVKVRHCAFCSRKGLRWSVASK